MSSAAPAISPAQFRLAIQDLPIGSLHAKAAELQNSIQHLQSSNDQMAEYADDPDMKEFVAENEEVIKRMQERISLLKEEVESRGMRWVEGEDYREGMPEPGENVLVNGVNGDTGRPASGALANGTARSASRSTTSQPSRGTSGRLTDEELQRLLAERMGEQEHGDEEEGVHL